MSMNIDRKARKAARREAFLEAYARARRDVMLKALRKQLMRTHPNAPEIVLKATGDAERNALMDLGFTVRDFPAAHTYGGQWVRIYWLAISREEAVKLLGQ